MIKQPIDRPTARSREKASTFALPVRESQSAPNQARSGNFRQPPRDGTDVASATVQMRNDRNQDEIARRTEQNVPVSQPSVETTAIDGAARSNDASISIPSPASLAPGILATSASFGNGDQKPLVTAATLPESTTTRFVNLVAHEAAVVLQTKPEALSVVLRPDNQTEITLNLTLHDGQVQAQATGANGDTAAWHARWADLQQTLAHQGVKLASLPSGQTFPPLEVKPVGTVSTRSGDSSGQSHHQNKQEKVEIDTPRFAKADKFTSRSLPRARANATRLFENWA